LGWEGPSSEFLLRSHPFIFQVVGNPLFSTSSKNRGLVQSFSKVFGEKAFFKIFEAFLLRNPVLRIFMLRNTIRDV